MAPSLPIPFDGPASLKNPAFTAWFSAQYVPAGPSNIEIAQAFSVSPGRVSQIAKELGLSRPKGDAVSAGMGKGRASSRCTSTRANLAGSGSHKTKPELLAHFDCDIRTLRSREGSGFGSPQRPCPHLRANTPTRKRVSATDVSIGGRLRATGVRWGASH